MELIALLLLAKTTTVEVVLNGAAVPVTVPLSLPPGEDASSFTPLAVATRFCAEHSISDGNCATMLAARGWAHYGVSEKHVTNMRVPCARPDGTKVTLVDAVQMAAPYYAQVFESF